MSSFLKTWDRLKRKHFDRPTTFVQAQITKPESPPKRKCTKIIVQPPGKDGPQDLRRLWMLKDTGADTNLIHKDLCDEIYGVDQFHWYNEPRRVYGLGGNAVRSLGRKHVYLSFKGGKDVYTAEVEVLPDLPDDNFDILLCEKFFEQHDLVKWSKKISGRVNCVIKNKRYSNPPPAFSPDAIEK